MKRSNYRASELIHEDLDGGSYMLFGKETESFRPARNGEFINETGDRTPLSDIETPQGTA